MIYLSLNKKVILYGFIFTFFSCFGQSFFIGLFNPNIRSELNIGQGQFGTIYALATLCSSLILIWFGKKIDEFRLFYYALTVIILLFFSALFFSFISNIYLLFLGIFFLRFSGQGLMIHTASTAISRFFDQSRGKALSTIWFGLSTAEFMMPLLITFILSLFSWRMVWQGIGLLIILVLPLLIYSTIRNISFESREENSNNLTGRKAELKIKDWTRKEVATPSTYYGYTRTAASSASNRQWSIRRVTNSGGSQSVTWNNNKEIDYSAIWDNKEDHFAALGSFTASSGLTYSTATNSTFTSPGSTYSVVYNPVTLNVSWTDLAGADKYQISVIDHTGVAYNYLGQEGKNTFSPTRLASETRGNSFQNFPGLTNMTYSVTVTAVNIISSESDTVVITT